jgi:transposase-like protein
LVLNGSTTCPLCRGANTTVTPALNTIYELPKMVLEHMFEPGKVHECAFCPHLPDYYGVMSAHANRCSFRSLTCPACHKPFRIQPLSHDQSAFDRHLKTDCDQGISLPPSILDLASSDLKCHECLDNEYE